MKTIHENRIARAARAIAARLSSVSEVKLSIPSANADIKIFRIMQYLNRYCGKYWIEYSGNIAVVRKQGN